jgi:hypothetical protein
MLWQRSIQRLVAVVIAAFTPCSGLHVENGLKRLSLERLDQRELLATTAGVNDRGVLEVVCDASETQVIIATAGADGVHIRTDFEMSVVANCMPDPFLFDGYDHRLINPSPNRQQITAITVDATGDLPGECDTVDYDYGPPAKSPSRPNSSLTISDGGFQLCSGSGYALDATFGDGDSVVMGFGDSGPAPKGSALQADGKILLVSSVDRGFSR